MPIQNMDVFTKVYNNRCHDFLDRVAVSQIEASHVRYVERLFLIWPCYGPLLILTVEANTTK